MSPVFVIQRT